jgi:hypothetical protein
VEGSDTNGLINIPTYSEEANEKSSFEFQNNDGHFSFFKYFNHKAIMSPYKKDDDDSSAALRELYAKYFPINTVYYRDDDNYQPISLVTYQNESSYYRHIQDSALKKALTITGGSLVAAAGLIGVSVGIGLLVSAQVSGYNNESIFGTSGPSKKALDMYYHTNTIIEG